MEYRDLGKTGLRVSVLSFGASSLGAVFRNVDHSDCLRTVHSAVDRGINLIDVSPYYGLTKAETELGRALKGIPRDSYYLATKVGRYGDAEFDFSAARVTRSVDESLTRLGVDYLDVIQCHDIEFGSLSQVVEVTIPALKALRRSGKVRFVGITGLPLKIFREVLAKTDVDTILSYCHYSLNDDSLRDILPFLKEKGVGVINASPLSMGLLSHRGTPPWHPAGEDIKTACRRVVSSCDELGINLEKLAVQFAVSNPEIPTTLVGTADPEHLARNLDWVEEPLDEEAFSAVLDKLSPIRNKTWASGRPENN